MRGEVLRRAAGCLRAQFGELLAHAFIRKNGVQLAVQLVDDRLGRSRRRHHARPRQGFIALQSGFAQRRHAGQDGQRRGAGHGQRLHLAGLRQRHRRRRVVEDHVDLAAHQIHQRLPAAFVRHVHQVHARHVLEQLAGQMGGASRARGRKGILAGVLAGQLDQVRHVGHGHVLVDDEHIADGRGVDDRQQIAAGLVARIGVEKLIDGQDARGAEQQRLAIGRGLGHHGGADIAARARAVLDDDRLLERNRQALGQQASDHVGRSAGREGHDQRDRTLRIRRIGGACGRGPAAQDGRGNGGQFPGFHFFPLDVSC
ncbi:hypothetical protein D3C87_1062120 [compost metagenome]